MGKKENYESRVERYLLPLMEEHHFELVDVEYVKEAGTWYLRAYIENFCPSCAVFRGGDKVGGKFFPLFT